MSVPLLLALAFAPSLGTRADAIPAQVPSAVVIESRPIEGRVLRGDYETPDRVLLVYTDAWPHFVADLGAQVLDSGGRVALVREIDSPRSNYARFSRRLAKATGVGGEQIEELTTVVETAWVRDWGPIQAHRAGVPLWLDSDYDDSERERDDLAPPQLAVHYVAPFAELPWTLDGGAFISNGEGLCALTLEYVEYSGFVRAEDDLGELLAQLGCRMTALLPTLVDEPTKHVDMIAQFVGPRRLIMAEIQDAEAGPGEDGLRLIEAELGLRRAAAILGFELEVVHVPTPPLGLEAPYHYSYVNGLHLGDRYVMPSYAELDPKWDLQAWDAVQDALPEVPVVPIESSNLIAAGGAVHCAALGLFL